MWIIWLLIGLIFLAIVGILFLLRQTGRLKKSGQQTKTKASGTFGIWATRVAIIVLIAGLIWFLFREQTKETILVYPKIVVSLLICIGLIYLSGSGAWIKKIGLSVGASILVILLAVFIIWPAAVNWWHGGQEKPAVVEEKKAVVKKSKPAQLPAPPSAPKATAKTATVRLEPNKDVDTGLEIKTGSDVTFEQIGGPPVEFIMPGATGEGLRIKKARVSLQINRLSQPKQNLWLRGEQAPVTVKVTVE